EYGVSISIGYGVFSSLSNTSYSLKLINTAYPLPLDTAYRSSDKKRMTKVIKEEFDKIEDVKVEDVSLTCDTPFEIFNNEVSRLSGIDDDSEHEADDDMGFDPSDVAGDDEVELTDEESSDDINEDAEVFRIDTNLFNFETPMCKAFNEFNYLLQIDPDLLTKHIEGFKTYEDYMNDWIYEWNKDAGCSEWPTCSWKDDGYCNGGNLLGTYIIENQLHYQDYEWYEALEDGKLKDEALRNKAIMEGFIKEDDDESLHELPICNVRRYMMIKYSFNDDDEYVAVKEDEYDNLIVTRKEACRAYQEIFPIMDEG
ncbi:hypothetical protein Tco_0587699, partial [Tanacetum coccineum]